MILLSLKIQSILKIVLICSISSALANIPELPKALIPQDLNWCWMASVLNCLYRVVPFRKTLSDVAQKHQVFGVKDSLEIYLNNLFTAMSGGDQPAVTENMHFFYQKFMDLNIEGFKFGEVNDLNAFYRTLCSRIFLNSGAESPVLYTQDLNKNQNTVYPLKVFIQPQNSFPRLAPICSLELPKGEGENYFLPNNFTKTDELGEKKYELVACAYGGTGHASAYIIKFKKWYGLDSMSKKLAPTDKTIQSITTNDLNNKSIRLWFYEQVKNVSSSQHQLTEDNIIPEPPKALIQQANNWCWMASVLNCLYRVIPFRTTLSDVAQKHQKSGVHNSLEIYLNNLFTAMSDGNQAAVNENMNAFYNEFISSESKHFKFGKVNDLNAFYRTLCLRIFQNSGPKSPVLYTQHSPTPTNANSVYPLKIFLQAPISFRRLAPICALELPWGQGKDYFLPKNFIKSDEFGAKKYKLVACAYGGGGHASASIVKFKKWYSHDTFNKNLTPAHKTIQSITTQGLEDYSLRLWFYEQIEPEWNVPSPLQQQLIDLSKSLQELKNKLSLLKTRLKELKKKLNE